MARQARGADSADGDDEYLNLEELEAMVQRKGVLTKMAYGQSHQQPRHVRHCMHLLNGLQPSALAGSHVWHGRGPQMSAAASYCRP